MSVVAVIAAATALAQSSVGQSALRNVGVVARAARYSELAFVDPLDLPTAVYRTPSQLTLPFTITNREGARHTYIWQLLVSDGASRVSRTGSVQLAPGQQAELDPSLTFRCVSRTRLVVGISTGQEIGSWTTCLQGPPPLATKSASGTPAPSRSGGTP